jgi:hypothetical protein
MRVIEATSILVRVTRPADVGVESGNPTVTEPCDRPTTEARFLEVFSLGVLCDREFGQQQ